MSSDGTNQAEQQPGTQIAKAASASLVMGDKGFIPRTRAEIWEVACWLIKGNMTPKGLDTPDKVCGAIITGSELGLTPAASLRVIAVVNGTPSVWGKGGYALAMKCPEYKTHHISWRHEDGKEYDLPPEYDSMDKIPGNVACICRVWRVGHDRPFMQKFSVNDAKLAKLWGRKSSSGADMPWSSYWWTMLYHKAVGNALEEAVPEAYYGLVNAPAEELEENIPGITPMAGMPTKPVNFTRDDDVYDVEPSQPVAKQQEPPKEPSKPVRTRTVKPEPVKDEEPPEPVEEPKPAAKPDPDPAFATTEQPKKKQPSVNVNAILKEFSSIHKHHKTPRCTAKDGKNYVCCDCGARYEVVLGGAATGFSRIENGDGSCDPKPAVAEDVNLQEPAAPNGMSSTCTSMLDDLREETKFSIGDAWDAILKRGKGAKTDREGEEASYMIEMAIRKLVELDPSQTGIVKAKQWIDAAKAYIDQDRIEIVRRWVASQSK